MCRLLSFISMVFLLGACTLTLPKEPLIHLAEDSDGHAMRTRRVVLRDDGVVLEELTDYFADTDKFRTTSKVRKMGAAELEDVLVSSEALIRELPSEVDETDEFAVHPKRRVIRSKINGRSFKSGWDSYDEGAASDESKAFSAAWDVILSRLIGVNGPAEPAQTTPKHKRRPN